MAGCAPVLGVLMLLWAAWALTCHPLPAPTRPNLCGQTYGWRVSGPPLLPVPSHLELDVQVSVTLWACWTVANSPAPLLFVLCPGKPMSLHFCHRASGRTVLQPRRAVWGQLNLHTDTARPAWAIWETAMAASPHPALTVSWPGLNRLICKPSGRQEALRKR